MQEHKLVKTLFFLGTFLCALGITSSLFLKKPKECTSHVAQNTYMGPTSPVPGNPQLILVELLIKDSSEAGGPQIESVTFNGRDIPLKPRDIFGKRGAASFQLPPGKYSLSWTVNRDKIVWPRVQSFEEEVSLNPRDLWVQIIIEGERASIL